MRPRELTTDDLKALVTASAAPLSRQIREVCRIGQGADCCRFLSNDGTGFHCAKLNDHLVEQIEVRRPDMIAQGDNCAGFALEVRL